MNLHFRAKKCAKVIAVEHICRGALELNAAIFHADDIVGVAAGIIAWLGLTLLAILQGPALFDCHL